MLSGAVHGLFFLQVFLPLFATFQGLDVPPSGLFVRRRVRGNRYGAVVCVKGDKGQVGRGDVANFSALHVFSLYPDPDLHGGPVGHVQAALEGEEVSDMNRTVEVYPINGGGHHVGSCKSGGNDKGGIVDELHDYPAVDIPRWIGMIGHHDVGDYGSAKVCIIVQHCSLPSVRFVVLHKSCTHLNSYLVDNTTPPPFVLSTTKKGDLLLVCKQLQGLQYVTMSLLCAGRPVNLRTCRTPCR